MKNNKYANSKIVWFPEKLASFRDGTITAPIYVRVKPHSACAHGCRWCVYSDGFRTHDAPGHLVSGMHGDMKSEADSIPRDKMLETLEDFCAMNVRAVTYTGGGEPLQHPDIVLFAKKTLDYGIDLSLITNGQMLQKSRAEIFGYAKWCRISMDYQNGDQIYRSRNVPPSSFGIIMRNIEKFSKSKQPSCDLGVNYIITRESYQGMGQFARALKDAGVGNVRFSPVWRTDFQEYHSLIASEVADEIESARDLTDENFSVYSSYNLDSPSHSPTRPYSKCYFMQMVPVVGADQNVYACHHKAFDKTGLIGSIANRRFSELWYSAEARRVFDELNPQHVCQHECANDQKNLFISSLLEAGSDNFV